MSLLITDFYSFVQEKILTSTLLDSLLDTYNGTLYFSINNPLLENRVNFVSTVLTPLVLRLFEPADFVNQYLIFQELHPITNIRRSN